MQLSFVVSMWLTLDWTGQVKHYHLKERRQLIRVCRQVLDQRKVRILHEGREGVKWELGLAYF